MKVVDASPVPEEQLALNDVLGIDTGEAILFSVAAACPDAVLATSDKRSLIALAGASGNVCQRLRDRLTHRVICFEQTILRIMNAIGFDSVLRQVIPAQNCDTALRAIFGSGLDATDEGVRAGLTGYIQHLKDQTGTLLIA